MCGEPKWADPICNDILINISSSTKHQTEAEKSTWYDKTKT